ncbi:MAG: four-carbon acid sugar kinase family protein [Paracoccaceae bacterium]
MAYVFVADDFTGASDTLATLARAGYRARLYRDLPDPGALAGIEAWGIATAARSLDRRDIASLAARIGSGLARHAPRFLHVKICSTFDSSADTGNIALLARGLALATGIADIAVIGGQPSLGRHAIFGTLFARGPDGRTHRIDRHPVMAAHPVTPMHEADLIRHLATLGLTGLHHVGRGQSGLGFPRFYDALDQADVTAAGQDLLATGKPLVVMGASSVAEGWLVAQAPRTIAKRPDIRAQGPVFAFAGSRSPQTAAQIAAADGLERLGIAPANLLDDPGPALHWAQARLARGQDCLVHLTAETAGIPPARLAQASAAFVGDVVARTRPGGLVVAGGDTSSAIVTLLAPDWLDYAADLCPGVPLLRAQVNGTGLLLALKGGQMGADSFFAGAIAAMRGG